MTVCQMQALSPDRFYLYKILYCRLFHPVFWRFGFIDIVAVAVSFLIKYMTTSLCCNIRRGLRGITRTMQIEFLKSA